ncbi:carnitine O-acetyltransferase-like isoform X2 [Saccostrea echinata]|uniref:carnitine O-acetyltransferase-like isoform X2 n=1 Tax=Saccostrea echinata TaxID=191078 RepID=UPI002A823196|nr:carnitine O-acetyltransferase-like isoform X2 [Saccostrea echinata]
MGNVCVKHKVHRVSCNLQRMQTDGKLFVGRMFSVQDSLPKLPVPPLEQTLQKYLRSVRPLLTDEEYVNTQKVVEDFKRDPGPKLQSLLEKRAQKETNWLSDWWTNTAYLEFRQPVTVNVSPGVVFPKQNYTDKEGQLRFTAKLISGLLDYKTMIDKQTLPVEKMGKQPLCMMQYYKILCGCRIPGKKKDSWVCYPPDEANPPKHFVVAHNNAFFFLEAYGSNNQALSTDQLYEQLKYIVYQSKAPEVPIGLLTTENRNKWAKSYELLLKDKETKTSLSIIQRSICLICIDNKLPDSAPGEEESTAAKMMLHGGGSQFNSANRWCDKTLQFIVGKNGVCGLNYEHTTAEGPPIISIVDHILDYCGKNEETSTPSPGIKAPRKLNFNLKFPELKENIEEAVDNIDSLVKDVDLNVFKFTEYGKNFPKSQKLSPDSYLQMAFQLAYYRLYSKPCATYETASLRQFQLGRTDTIRSCSMESLEFSKGMMDSTLSKQKKAELLRKAVAEHKNYVAEAIKGQGIDRHLLGLKLIALQNNMKVPALHMDMAYSLSSHHNISTSQVPAKHEACLVFGPTVPDGYGVCYNPQEKQIIFGVSAFNCCPETESRKFIDSIRQSLYEMKTVLEGSVQSKL